MAWRRWRIPLVGELGPDQPKKIRQNLVSIPRQEHPHQSPVLESFYPKVQSFNVPRPLSLNINIFYMALAKPSKVILRRTHPWQFDPTVTALWCSTLLLDVQVPELSAGGLHNADLVASGVVPICRHIWLSAGAPLEFPVCH